MTKLNLLATLSLRSDPSHPFPLTQSPLYTYIPTFLPPRPRFSFCSRAEKEREQPTPPLYNTFLFISPWAESARTFCPVSLNLCADDRRVSVRGYILISELFVAKGTRTVWRAATFEREFFLFKGDSFSVGKW